MSSETKKLLAGVLKLPAKSRAMIAEKLLESLDAQPALDAAVDEAEDRWQAYLDGKMKGIPLEELFPNLTKKAKRIAKT